LVQTAVEYLFEDQLCNYTNSVEEASLHFSSQIHLDTPCSGLEEPQVT
jgi:hypothetical protein